MLVLGKVVKLITDNEGDFYVTDEGRAVLDGLDPKKYCNLVFIFGQKQKHNTTSKRKKKDVSKSNTTHKQKIQL